MSGWVDGDIAWVVLSPHLDKSRSKAAEMPDFKANLSGKSRKARDRIGHSRLVVPAECG